MAQNCRAPSVSLHSVDRCRLPVLLAKFAVAMKRAEAGAALILLVSINR
jgi:hypothetical protein